MNLDQDIRAMLRARAQGVAAAPMIPHSTLRRARVRKTLMTGSVAAAGAALVFGAFAASGSLSRDAAPIVPAIDFPNLTRTFVSPTNGFSVKHPDRVTLTPAKDDWGGGNDRPNEGFDVVETGLSAVFSGASTDIPPAGSLSSELPIDDWADEISDGWPGGCGEPRSKQAEIAIDGRSGRISECANRIEATVVAGGRFYLFILSHDRDDARAVFDAFAATIELTPETAVFLPKMTGRFVSPTYGYSFKYLDRGGLTQATELWDPAKQPPIDELIPRLSTQIGDQFDTVETGYAVFLMSASAKIPDGVSLDEWVADHVWLGCGEPRSQQAEIVIDGRLGRISECPREIGATVVAGGRLYLFALVHDRDEARAFFDAWVDTIDLTPQTAAVS